LEDDHTTLLSESVPKQSSIELNKTTRGYTWGIKVYFDENDPGDLDDAKTILAQTDAQLRSTYDTEE